MGKIFGKAFLALFILLSGIPAFSQSLAAIGDPAANGQADINESSSETDELTEFVPKKGDLWISPGVEMAMFDNALIGYSLAIGYGKGASVGIKASYYSKTDGLSILELAFLLRFYLSGTSAYSGPFLQLSGGPTLISICGNLDFPSETGVLSGGISFGWRFLFIDRFFIEPSIRGGYPYMFGAGLSGGIRF
jgi:hypothetical protein